MNIKRCEMELVNYFPSIGDEKKLPIFLYGIGVGHNQEHIDFTDGIPGLHIYYTVSGCGVYIISGTKKLLPQICVRSDTVSAVSIYAAFLKRKPEYVRPNL